MTWVWRGLLLLVVGVGGGWLGLVGAQRALGAENPAPQERLSVAQRGDLVDSVSASGTLSLPHQESLIFGSAGTLQELLVTEGAEVREGQVLARLDSGTQATLRKATAQARVNLAKAKEASESLTAGPEAKALTAAQAKVETSQVALDNANRDLSLAKTDWTAKLDQAREQLTDAGEAYALVFERYLGIDLTHEEEAREAGELLTAWGADLDKLFDPYGRAEISKGWYADDPTDDPATRWNEMVLYAWRNFAAARPAPATVRAEMDAGWTALDKARTSLVTQETQSAKALANAENAVARAKETLEDARNALTDLRAPADLEDLALAQADVAAADSALATALDREAKTVMRAPFAGVVGTLNVKQGQSVAANTTIVSLVDPSEVQLEGAVNEVDVARIQTGQEVTITLEAIPGATLQGKVVTVALVGRNAQGVVSFPVTIEVQRGSAVALRDGMTASATIVTARQSGVILVPPRALRGTLAAPRVEVLSKGKREERTVTISGLTTQAAAVTSGLQPGDVLVLPATTGSALSSLPGGFRAFAGGGAVQLQGGGGRAFGSGGQGGARDSR